MLMNLRIYFPRFDNINFKFKSKNHLKISLIVNLVAHILVVTRSRICRLSQSKITIASGGTNLSLKEVSSHIIDSVSKLKCNLQINNSIKNCRQ